jgi:Fe-S-cluster containining protein
MQNDIGMVGLNKCAVCAHSGNGNCCKKANIVLTLGDISRIGSDCWEYRKCNYQTDQRDPLWNVLFKPDGSIRLLKIRLDGNCCMLNDVTGCILLSENRPLVCRLYPYNEFTEFYLEKEPDPKLSDCPLEFSKNGNLADVIGCFRDEAVRLHKQFYDELRAEKENNV